MEDRTKESLFAKYWGGILRRAIDTAWREGALRNRTLAFVVGLGLVPLLGKEIGIGSLAINYLIALCVALVLGLIAVVYEPPKLHDEAGGFIEYPFELSARTPQERDANELRAASLVVRNLTSVPVEGCFLSLDKITNQDGQPLPVEPPRKLDWSSRVGADGQRVKAEISLVRHDEAMAHVAETVRGHDKARLAFWTAEFTIDPGVYSLEVSPHGQWKGKTIQPQPRSFVLVYKGNNQLAIWAKDDPSPPVFPLPTRSVPAVEGFTS